MLFHKDIYLPKELKEEALKLAQHRFTFSAHIWNHFREYCDRYSYTKQDIINALSYINEQKIEPFEVETKEGKVIKGAF